MNVLETHFELVGGVFSHPFDIQLLETDFEYPRTVFSNWFCL